MRNLVSYLKMCLFENTSNLMLVNLPMSSIVYRDFDKNQNHTLVLFQNVRF